MVDFNDRRGHNGDRRRGFLKTITDMASDALWPYTGKPSDRVWDVLAPTTVPRKPGTPHPMSKLVEQGRSMDSPSTGVFGESVDMRGLDTSTGLPMSKKDARAGRRQAKKSGW